MITVKSARADLTAELRRTDQRFDDHAATCPVCREDSDDCNEADRYRERITTLNFAIEVLGGRPRIRYCGRLVPIYGHTTIPELYDSRNVQTPHPVSEQHRADIVDVETLTGVLK